MRKERAIPIALTMYSVIVYMITILDNKNPGTAINAVIDYLHIPFPVSLYWVIMLIGDRVIDTTPLTITVTFIPIVIISYVFGSWFSHVICLKYTILYIIISVAISTATGLIIFRMFINMFQ